MVQVQQCAHCEGKFLFLSLSLSFARSLILTFCVLWQLRCLLAWLLEKFDCFQSDSLSTLVLCAECNPRLFLNDWGIHFSNYFSKFAFDA